MIGRLTVGEVSPRRRGAWITRRRPRFLTRRKPGRASPAPSIAGSREIFPGSKEGR
jgi:hypothetical protein